MERKSERAYLTEQSIFATRLSDIMEKRGLSQTNLQAKIFEQSGKTLQRQTISLYMNGQSRPDTERLTLLCKALNISADYLLGLSKHKSLDEDLKAVCEYTNLSEDAVNRVHNPESITEFDFSIVEGLEAVSSSAELLSILNKVIERDSGSAFLTALYMVKVVTDDARCFYERIQASGEECGHEVISEYIRRLKIATYELAESSRYLAQDLFESDNMISLLTLASRRTKRQNDKTIVDAISWLEEGMKNGEHQEN